MMKQRYIDRRKERDERNKIQRKGDIQIIDTRESENSKVDTLVKQKYVNRKEKKIMIQRKRRKIKRHEIKDT